jgi:gliding motility-associated-like protein
VFKRGEVYVPNVFAPETDGLNAFFRVFAGNPLTRVGSMQVFDRWGEKAFDVRDVSPDDAAGWWDGTLNGEKMLPGVYVWVMEVVYGDGRKEQFRGDVTLIR